MFFSLGYYISSYILTSIGFYFIFKKCGVKPYWAVVPLVREYNIGLCAYREEDAKNYLIISVLDYALAISSRFLSDYPVVLAFMLIPYSAVGIAKVVYAARIFVGLCETFERKKLWAVLLTMVPGITTIIWGLVPKFVPKRQVFNPKAVEGARMFGGNLSGTGSGLVVNLEKRTAVDFFKKKTLLKDVHLSIPKGHMVLLLGGSGAGKTTFLNAVTGYEKAKADIELDGGNVDKQYEKMKYDIGFVPQQDLMRGNDTVLLTLSDAATLRVPKDVHAAERKARVDKVLEQFGLTPVKNNLVEKLSGGQRKRLSIAMEFISDPSLFILDEPDSGLDGVVARSLFESLRSIADEGKIVIVITHTPDRVIDLFDDVIVLAKDATRTGRLSWYGPVDEAYEFFGKNSMEEILLSINQLDEGGEGRADEFVEKYSDYMKEKVG